MADISAMIERLIAAGCDPVTAACVVAEAVVAGHQTTAFRDGSLERRREYDRERMRAKRAAEKAAKSVAEQTVSADSPPTSDDSADKGETVSLSPVPLLSPTPPNNPLTPNPIQKNNPRGARLPADWTLAGEDLDYALSKGLLATEAGELAERFSSWAWSASGQNARKVNWHQAWQGWVQRDGPKIIRARAGPAARPISPYQQSKQTLQDIRNDLKNFASAGSDGRGQNPRLLPGDSGERPEGLRSGAGGAVIDLPASGGRARN